MKKYLFALAASLLLFGGVVTAQEEVLENEVVLTMDDVELPKDTAGAYVLLTDGIETSEYKIDFEIETSSEHPPEIGLCLKRPDGTSEGPLPVSIPGDYPNGLYTVSSCNEEDPQLSFDLLILADADLDGVADNVDTCLDSDLAETVVIGECDSGVANTLLEDGCTIAQRIMACADGVVNHGEFVSCVSRFTNGLKPRVLSGAEKGAIQSCAAQSSIGGLPCEPGEPDCDEDGSGLGQNRHRARYEFLGNDLIIPCVDLGGGQYVAVDMNLSSATSNNFHFKVKKAEMMTQMAMSEIADPEGTCAHYDLLSNSLTFPSLEIGENQWRVQMKLLGANSANLHFKLQSITEVAP
jgi:hypothetical protein